MFAPTGTSPYEACMLQACGRAENSSGGASAPPLRSAEIRDYSPATLAGRVGRRRNAGMLSAKPPSPPGALPAGFMRP